jgi:amino acid transporter
MSVLAVMAFVLLKLLGARSSGLAENLMVAVKVLILLLFGLFGFAYILGSSGGSLQLGIVRLVGFTPILAAAMSFVAFQGWQLLFYDQESITKPVDTITSSVAISIPVAVCIYVIVGLVTVNLVPEAIVDHPHVALKDAAGLMMTPYGLVEFGAIVLSLSALFSTGSAINATLFSSAPFVKGMLSDGLLPDDLGESDADGVPKRTLLVIGATTAVFSIIGSLNVIMSFASLSFILVFGAMSLLAFSLRHQ